MRHLSEDSHNGNRITNVGAPAAAGDAANKAYVDNAIGSLQLRTMNGEQLTDSSLGDINIHDGFYFPNAVQDFDGNWYGAVVIGDQVWLGENLRTTHYVNGTEIQTGASASTSTPYKYIPNNDAENVTEYGYLYNYPSVIGGTMLSGWRIPSRTNLGTLVDYIKKQKRYQYNNSSQNVGKSLASTNGWTAHTTDGAIGTDPELNNASGFNAKPAGDYRKVNPNPSETIRDFGIIAGFLSSTSPSNDVVSTLELSNGMTTASVLNQRLKSDAFSVRCISKLTPIQFRDWYIKQYGSMQHILPASGGAGRLTVTDDNNGNIALSLNGGSQSLVTLDDNNGNITLILN